MLTTRRMGLIALLLVACGGAPPPAKNVSIRFQGAPKDATVIVDDTVLGSFEYVALRGVALPRGEHRVTVQAPGYFPWDKLISATGDPIHLDVQLVKIPE